MTTTSPGPALGPKSLDLDALAECEFIAARLRQHVATLKRRGVVVAVSGGIDSSVCCALATRAFGKEKVFALLLPETDSSPTSETLGRRLVEACGVAFERQDIAPTLAAIGCYTQRDAAIRDLFPAYRDDWKNKIIIGGGLQGGFNHFKLVVQAPGGELQEKRLPLKQYLQIVASQNYKQRMRKAVEYFHAERLNYAVIGTPNRLEYDQGFFVKNGDGAADIKPIAHLYKTQVYALARHLGLPDDICRVRPTTDTYSLEQSQDEFYFALPYEQMDLALWALNHGLPEAELAVALGITPERAGFIYKDIRAKREATRGLHSRPLLMRPVDEIHTYA